MVSSENKGIGDEGHHEDYYQARCAQGHREDRKRTYDSAEALTETTSEPRCWGPQPPSGPGEE